CYSTSVRLSTAVATRSRGYASSAVCCFLVFFFQAEDGIRDSSVTGVQTCALPIFMTFIMYSVQVDSVEEGIRESDARTGGGQPRSEERRGGKEWRRRGSTYREENKLRLDV